MTAEPVGTLRPAMRPGAGGAVRRTAPARRRRPAPRTARPASLRLVADGGRLVPQESGPQAGPGHDRVRTEARLVCANGKDRLVCANGKDRLACANRLEMPRQLRERPAPAGTGRTAPAPVRLTRRGRLVITVAAALAIGALSVALAGAAQATGHSGALAGPGRAVTKVEVRSGQNLWSIAEAYDPDADTRFVIQDILQLNSLTSDQLQPGQVLWVPRG